MMTTFLTQVHSFIMDASLAISSGLHIRHRAWKQSIPLVTLRVCTHSKMGSSGDLCHRCFWPAVAGYSFAWPPALSLKVSTDTEESIK